MFGHWGHFASIHARSFDSVVVVPRDYSHLIKTDLDVCWTFSRYKTISTRVLFGIYLGNNQDHVFSHENKVAPTIF
jgi:hypothetical protein